MFSLICAWTNGWISNRDASDLRRHRTHYDVIVMLIESLIINCEIVPAWVLQDHIDGNATQAQKMAWFDAVRHLFVHDSFKFTFLHEYFSVLVTILYQDVPNSYDNPDVSTSFGNDLAPTRRRAIVWTNIRSRCIKWLTVSRYYGSCYYHEKKYLRHFCC